jgi:HK97 gp10 family phage protein
MKFEGKLEGFDALRKILKELPANVEKRVAQRAALASLRETKAEFVAAAPKSNERSQASLEYGQLHKNIKISRKKRVDKGQKGAVIHTGNAFWGYIYEKGSRYQPARPWFLPTFTKVREKILSSLSTKIGEGIIKEVERLK